MSGKTGALPPTTTTNCPCCSETLPWEGEIFEEREGSDDWYEVTYHFAVKCTGQLCACEIPVAEWDEMADEVARRLRGQLAFAYEAQR